MTKKFIFTLGSTLLVAGTASASLVLSETWSDGDRTNMDLPTSTAWYTSRASGTLTATAAGGGSMTQDVSLGGTHVTGYLTSAGRIDLAIGESIELNFEVSFENISGSGSYFRFGLFDSTAVNPRIAIDNNMGGGFAGTRGFMANVEAQNQGAGVNLQRRNGNSTNGTLILSTNGYFSNGVEFDDTLSEALVSDVIYTGTMVVTRSGIAENIVSASMTGPNGTIFSLGTWTETAPGVVSTGFDLIAFGLSDAGRDSFTLHSVTVQVIPEPSTMALLFGFMAIGAVCTRRVAKS
jgi:hypothetical protein